MMPMPGPPESPLGKQSFSTGAKMAATLLVTLLLGSKACYRGYAGGFAADVSGLPLPSAPWRIFAHDDAEMSVLVHVRLSTQEQQSVRAAAAFHPARHEASFGPAAPVDFLRSEELPPVLRSIDANHEVLHAGGCHPEQAWVALLDADSGDLWVEVQYPDHSGDVPPCTFKMDRAPSSPGR
jgi:hypothetical protein